MILITSDEKRIVDIGTVDNWISLYSTIAIRLQKMCEDIPLVLRLLKDGRCLAEEATEAARQMNLVRDGLASVRVEEIVYDMNNINKKAPWVDEVSSIVTSAGNFFITADGKDLLFEIVSILTYAGVLEVSVSILD